MDNVNAVELPKARIEVLPKSQREKLCLKISVAENKYKVKFEHKHAQEASVDVQKLALNFADILKRTIIKTPADAIVADTVSAHANSANNSPVDAAPVKVVPYTETTDSSNTVTENRKLKAELMLLRQHSQELEGNVLNLRQDNQILKQRIEDLQQEKQTLEKEYRLLHEVMENSIKTSQDLVAGFRAATHARAGRIAMQYSKVNADQTRAKCHELEDVQASIIQSTTKVRGPPVPPMFKQEAEVFLLKPRLKEIDFFSLDEILGGNKSVKVSSDRVVEDFSEEDGQVVEKTSDSVPEISFDDNGTSLGHQLTQKAEIPNGTPPTVLKVGLDIGIARAGGLCKNEISYGSPIYRHRHVRDEVRKIVSYAEHGDIICADDDLPGNFTPSKIDDVIYSPSPNNGTELKAVFIGNLPHNINYDKLLAKVRGGPIVSATLCDTRAVAGCARRISAFIIFIKSESARLYVDFAQKHGICFGSERAAVTLIATSTRPLSIQAIHRIECNHHTRYFMIKEDGSNLDLVKIIRIINFDVNEYRKEAMEKAWKDEHGNVRILFASISAASHAHWKLTKRLFHDPSKVEFQDDPCGGPLTDLLPYDNIVDTTGPKLNYGGEDIRDEKVKVEQVTDLAGSKIGNDDEINLEADSDEKFGNDNIYSGTEGEKDTPLDIPPAIKEISVQTLMKPVPQKSEASIIIDKSGSTECEGPKQILGLITLKPLTCPVLAGTEDALQLQKSSPAETFTINEDAISEETIAEKTIAEETIAEETIAEDFKVNEGTNTSTTSEISSPSSEKSSFTDTDVLITPNSGAEVLEIQNPVSTPSQLSNTSFDEPSQVTNESPPIPRSEVEVIAEVQVKSASIPPFVTPDKFNLDGTDIDPVLLPRYVFDTVLAAKPRGGLSSSKWADPNTEPTAPIILKAPDFVPTLSDAPQLAHELLFGKGTFHNDTESDEQPVPLSAKSTSSTTDLVSVPAEQQSSSTENLISVDTEPISTAPANAPKGPRAGIPNSRWANSEGYLKPLIKNEAAEVKVTASTQATETPKAQETAPALTSKPNPPTGPKFMPRKIKSRYAKLGPDNSQPRSTLRSFYSEVDSAGKRGQ